MTAPSTSPTTHSRLSPSAASRWTVCTASPGFIARNAAVLPKESSSYADEGTKAHDLAAQVLLGRHRLVHSDDADMLINVRAYIDFVRSKQRSDDIVQIERKVALFYLPKENGTVDVRLIGKDRIAIIDLKYGAGVGVYAENNSQLAIYAESAIRELETVQDVSDDMPIELYIFQPRDRNDPEPVREWVLTRKQLREFTAPIETTAKAILADFDGGEFVPNPEKQCRFCAAAGICKAYASYGLSVISSAPVDVAVASTPSLPDPGTLTREQRVRVIQMRSGVEKWLAAVEDQEMTELLSGAEPMGFKLVEGKSNRKWTDEAKAIEVMQRVAELDVVAPREAISPAQADKLFKKDEETLEALRFLTEKPQGKPTLVPETDKRPRLEFNPAMGIENLDVV